MKEIVLITGANGMLAKHLAKHLEKDYSLRFLSRKVTQSNYYQWDLKNKYIDPKAFIGVQYIIHLAGSPISDKRWNKKRKQDILSSRVDSSHLILEELKKHKISIKAFISASAVGYYGTKSTEIIFNEESPKGNDFLSDVCSKWEDAAYKFNNVANRVSVIRIGIILAKNDGALKRILQPIKYGIGSGIGTGNQYMPWIHIHDLCSIFKFIADNEHISGTFNGVSPEHITNLELTKRIGKVLNRKIILPNIPGFLIKALFGEMSIILLKGSRVSSDKIIQMGFGFKYKTLNEVLNNILE